jgi:3'(2'), 5'-bisphosphate nucleotidase
MRLHPPFDRPAALPRVLAIAEEAAIVVMRAYAETAPHVEYKGRGTSDPVTGADREANALICAALAREFPGVPIVAEESDPSSFAGFASAPAAWFVDPLDGTREFILHNGEFGVMIGLAEGGRATLGVVVCPALGRTFVGGEGLGAFEVAPDGTKKPLRVSGVRVLADAEIVVSRSHRPKALDTAASRHGVRKVTPCGSAGVKAARVASGEAEVYAQPGRAGKRWDSCGPEAIVLAAGGLVTDAHGATIDYASGELDNDRGFVATNGALHGAVLDLLRGV